MALADATRGRTRGRVGWIDLAVVLWVLASVLLGVRLHEEVQGLTGLTVTAERVGGQLEGLGADLAGLDIPFVGGELDGLGEEAQAAGAQARRQAVVARESVDNLAWLLAVSIIALAVGPVLLAYIPLRLRTTRERVAAQRLAARAQADPELRRLLAQRAIVTMSDRELAGLDGRPWSEPPRAAGARAEL